MLLLQLLFLLKTLVLSTLHLLLLVQCTTLVSPLSSTGKNVPLKICNCFIHINVWFRINPSSDVITKIILAQGISTNIQPLITIAENVDTKLGTYSWNVPADILPGTDYAFVLGVSPNVSYTGQFTIKNENVAVSSGAVSSSAAASVAASSVAATPSAATSKAAVTPAAAPSVAAPSAAASSGAAPSGSSHSAHASASATPTASSSSSAGSSNKVAFGVVAAAGVAVMALI